MKGRYDNLHGDEPEYERMASMAEAGRDVDAEIDRKKAQMDAEDALFAQAKRKEAMAQDFRYRCCAIIRELTTLIGWTDMPGGPLPSHAADNVAKQAERLQALCREMAK